MKFFFFLIFLGFHEFVLNSSKLDNRTCDHFKRIAFYNYNNVFLEITLKNFFSFSEINFACAGNFYVIKQVINIFPRHSIFLDNSLDFSSITPTQSSLDFQFLNLKGLKSDLKIFDILIKQNDSIKILFIQSKISLQFSSFANKSTDSIAIFKDIDQIIFMNNCEYNINTSPWLFANSKINILNLNGIVDTILKKNIIGFSKSSKDVNCHVNFLNLNFYQALLDEKLLNKNIFKNLYSILINGRVKSISNKIFDNLFFLKELILENDFDLYYNKNGLEFLTSINTTNDTVNLMISFYEYPDGDFCLFKDFPTNRHLLATAFPYTFNCSCLYLWLIDKYYQDIGFNLLVQNQYCFNFENKTCDFYSFLNKCNSTSFNKKNNYIKDIFFRTEYLSAMLLVLNPIFSVFGLITNFLCILVLNKLIKSTKGGIKVYQLMNLNSVLNFIFAFIYIFHTFSICAFVSGSFCPKLSHSVFMQIYEVYVVDFSGGMIKNFSNVLSLFISFERFKNINSKSTKILEKKKSTISILILVFGCGFFFNMDKILTSAIDFNPFILSLDEYPEFPIRNTFKGIFDPDLPNQSRFFNFKESNPFYFAIYCLNIFINDFLLVLLLILLDFLLMTKFRSDLGKKRKLIKSVFSDDTKKLKKNNESAMRITKIILIYITLLLFLRSIELSLNMMVLMNKISKGYCDIINKICTNYYLTANFIYLISSSMTIFVYSFINKNFKNCLLCYFNLKLSSAKKSCTKN